jgi:hypothetical protein
MKPDAWLARDECGELWVFKNKPHKNDDTWLTENGDWWWINKNHPLGKGLTWEDGTKKVWFTDKEAGE